MNAITLLTDDHRTLRALLARGEDTTDRAVKTRREILARLTTELRAHEAIEEQILYPALKIHPQAKDIVLEGYQEHHVADLLIKELHAMPVTDERWGAKFSVLKENIEHHIEEEEDDMFRKARTIFRREELETLGDLMHALKQKTRRAA